MNHDFDRLERAIERRAAIMERLVADAIRLLIGVGVLLTIQIVLCLK